MSKLLNRRRSAPWWQRHSRPMMGILAGLGAIETAYITITHWLGGSVVCPTTGCEQVLKSDYAQLFGIPLSLVGFGFYLAVAVVAVLLAPRQEKEQDFPWAWALFALTTAMLVSSGYFVYLMAVKIGAWCVYCVTSAILSLLLWFLATFGRVWRDVGQLFTTALVVVLVALLGILAAYNGVEASVQAGSTAGQVAQGLQSPPPVTTSSGAAELALAEHLRKVGAKEYGAYWCPHCHQQKQLFGKEAGAKINYIECDPKGVNSQTQKCIDVGIKGYPTWEINGKLYPGVKTLDQLAELTGYKGPRNFINPVGKTQ
ncbi:MAG: vitamin K epoxide reductase family protein [Gloeomargarita sp. DG02_4_bins_56]